MKSIIDTLREGISLNIGRAINHYSEIVEKKYPNPRYSPKSKESDELLRIYLKLSDLQNNQIISEEDHKKCDIVGEKILIKLPKVTE